MIGASSVLNEQEGKGKVEEEREGKQGKEGLGEMLKLCFSGCANSTNMGQAASITLRKPRCLFFAQRVFLRVKAASSSTSNHLLGSVLSISSSVFFCRGCCLALLSKRVSGKTKGRKEEKLKLTRSMKKSVDPHWLLQTTNKRSPGKEERRRLGRTSAWGK